MVSKIILSLTLLASSFSYAGVSMIHISADSQKKETKVKKQSCKVLKKQKTETKLVIKI